MQKMSDFQKVSVAFGVGMGSVVLGLAFKTGWKFEAVSLTLLIPCAAFSVWAFYEMKKVRAERMKNALDEVLLQRRAQAQKIAKDKLSVLFGENRNDNPLAYIPSPHRGERRVLLPRDHEVTKQRILQGRGEYIAPGEEVNSRDQWHD